VGDLWTDTIDHRLLPGDGDFDVAGFVRAIGTAGYAGAITVDVLNRELRGRPPREVAKLAFERSRAAIEAALTKGA
jgi:sugar phosphate isomerase/epimerase